MGITGDTAVPWTATAIFVTPTEEIRIGTMDPEADIEIAPTPCRDRYRDDRSTADADEK